MTDYADMRAKAITRLEESRATLTRHENHMQGVAGDLGCNDQWIAEIAAKRDGLLARKAEAQTALQAATNALDLAIGTPAENEYRAGAAQVERGLQSITRELLALSGEDDRLKTRREELAGILRIAQESSVIQQRAIRDAQTTYDEIDAKHRAAITQTLLADLNDAKQTRDETLEILRKAEALVQATQSSLARCLSEWPDHAVAVLSEHGEFADDLETEVLAARLASNRQLETAFAHGFAQERAALAVTRNLSPLAQALAAEVPLRYIAHFGMTSQEWRSRSGTPDTTIARFIDAQAVIEQETESRRAVGRDRAARALIYGNPAAQPVITASPRRGQPVPADAIGATTIRHAASAARPEQVVLPGAIVFRNGR